MDLNQYLSPHFRLFEFVTSEIAERRGISNVPSQDAVDNLRHLCMTILEPAREALGPIRVLSGYRCPLLNLAVGGSATSDHPKGDCGDVIPMRVSKIEFAKWVIENCKFDQVILEFGTKFDPAWIHVSSNKKYRGEVLQKLQGMPYVVVKDLNRYPVA